MDGGEGGRKGCGKMPASAVKTSLGPLQSVFARVHTDGAFAQSALTPFKVTAS